MIDRYVDNFISNAIGQLALEHIKFLTCLEHVCYMMANKCYKYMLYNFIYKVIFPSDKKLFSVRQLRYI